MPGFEVIGQEEFEQVKQVFESGGVLFRHGFDDRRNGVYKVRDFEEAFARKMEVEHALAVTSGTAALRVALAGISVGPGDEVITQAFTFVATVEAIIEAGATPIVTEVDSTLNMDPEDLERRITPETKAIIVVHAFGLMADNPRILELAAEHQIPMVEDAACALGAKLDDRPAGIWGDVGCFSFHPRKLVTTGEGGAIVTSNPKIAAFAREFRDHGRRMTDTKASFVIAGLNYRLTDFQAALGLSQLKRIDEILERQRDLARSYRNLLHGLPIALPVDGGLASTWQSFVVRLESGTDRDTVIEKLGELGVESSLGTIALPLTEHFSKLSPVIPQEFPVVSDVSGSSLALPFFSTMTDADQQHVAQALETAL